MRQIIELAVPLSDYPDTVAALDQSERTMLLAIRWWVAAHQSGDNAMMRVCGVLRCMGVEAAASSLNRLMDLAARSTWRRVVTYCPCSPDLGKDEKHLLYPICLVQNGESDPAARVLQSTMLTTEGSVLALGPLEEISDHFAKARLPFRRRRAPPTRVVFPPSVEGWLSSLSGTSIH
jgi:hypothetical protein